VSEDQSVERLSVTEAAERLGVSRDAIHKRIRMGSIEHEQGADGRFYVYVDTSMTDAEKSTNVSIDDRTDLLIAEMQDRIRSLEEANRENRRIIAALTSKIPAIRASESPQSETSPGPSEASPERAGEVPVVSEALPSFPAPSQDVRAPETVPETSTPTDAGEVRESASERPDSETPRSWWRRMFGG
jgi:excisionase family DNA binding protein